MSKGFTLANNPCQDQDVALAEVVSKSVVANEGSLWGEGMFGAGGDVTVRGNHPDETYDSDDSSKKMIKAVSDPRLIFGSGDDSNVVVKCEKVTSGPDEGSVKVKIDVYYV